MSHYASAPKIPLLVTMLLILAAISPSAYSQRPWRANPVPTSYYAHYFSTKENVIGLVITLRGWPHTGGVNDCGLVQPTDVSKVVDWLSQQPGVDPDRIGIVGESQG